MYEELKISSPNRASYIKERGEINPDALIFIEDEDKLITPQKEYQFVTSEMKEKIDNIQKVSWGVLGVMSNGHEYVDMGEAGLWATCNVGASKPEEYGDYFGWGEISNKATFTWGNYRFGGNDQGGQNKYNSTDHLTTLELEDDAAHVIMGGDWRMPSMDELKKLVELCDFEWISDYNNTGVTGALLKLKTDNSRQLFIPAAGRRDDVATNQGTTAYLWTNSLDSNVSGYMMILNASGTQNSNSKRHFGRSIRGIIK